MEVRNVQRTGKMHYVYLPTSWCKKHGINSDTQVTATEQPDGSLVISPGRQEKPNTNISLTLPGKNKEALINLIMACYVNPIQSFKINLDEDIDMPSLLHQKSIISALEFVELDGEHITYEANMMVHDPSSLLKTMVKKIKNLFYVLEAGNPQLIQKYEEEIDRSKILIQKSVISALVVNQTERHAAIDLYYIVQIATELERIVDTLILGTDKQFREQTGELIEELKGLLEKTSIIDYKRGALFATHVAALKDAKNPEKQRIKRLFQSIVEVILDWAITNEIRN